MNEMISFEKLILQRNHFMHNFSDVSRLRDTGLTSIQKKIIKLAIPAQGLLGQPLGYTDD